VGAPHKAITEISGPTARQAIPSHQAIRRQGEVVPLLGDVAPDCPIGLVEEIPAAFMAPVFLISRTWPGLDQVFGICDGDL